MRGGEVGMGRAARGCVRKAVGCVRLIKQGVVYET